MQDHKIRIPTLTEKWDYMRNFYSNEGFDESHIVDMKAAFYTGIRVYIELQKELRNLGVSSPEMDRIIHSWELEAF